MQAREGRGPSRQLDWRPLFGALLAFLLLALVAASGAGASTRSRLQGAKDRLSSLESQIQAEQDTLHSMQGRLNVLAGRIDAATGLYQQTQSEVMTVRDVLARDRERYASIRNRLDQRAADAYMEGPASGLDALLGSSTIGQVADRFEFLDSVAQHDSDLATTVQNLANRVHQREVVLNKILDKQAAALRQLNEAQSSLDAQFRHEKAIENDLSQKRSEVESLVGKLKKKIAEEERARALALARSGGNQLFNIADNPLHMCPVGQPHAFGDSFGAPRYTTSPPHPHAGEDIMAPRGTPIYATFDGVAEADPNGLGGNAVVVRGADGYTYNAHLDSYGKLGAVHTGDVVGYVGDSGDAAGGPTHDHFEWHPNVLPSPLYQSPYGYTDIDGAVDSYPYLIQVC
jgi:peptidoglycan hydrolase CwlO-like protein